MRTSPRERWSARVTPPSHLLGDFRDPKNVDAFMQWFLGATRREYEEQGALRCARAGVLTMRDHHGFTKASPGVHFLLAAMAFDAAGKDLFRDLIADHCVQYEAFGVLFCSEVWLAVATEIPKPGDPMPSERPDRKEAVFVTLEHVALPGTQSYVAIITRDAEGKPTLGPFQRGEDPSGIEGRFSNLLKPIKMKFN